jgi:predicted nucleotidyltransferase
VRGEATERSDYDLLVDFRPDAKISLFEFSRIQVDLEELIGTKVDLVPKDGLKPLVRERVLAEARPIYEE